MSIYVDLGPGFELLACVRFLLRYGFIGDRTLLTLSTHMSIDGIVSGAGVARLGVDSELHGALERLRSRPGRIHGACHRSSTGAGTLDCGSNSFVLA